MPKFKPYPDESPSEALERISENIENEGFPTANAMERSENYQLGGAVRPPTSPSIAPQLRLSYNLTNYAEFATAIDGALTVTTVGANNAVVTVDNFPL